MENVSIIAQFKKKKSTDAHGTIIIRGYFARRPVAARSTGHRILAEHWDPERREVRAAAPNARLINTNVQIKLQEMQKQLLQQEIIGHRPNRTAVAKAVRGIDEKRDFLAFCRERIKEDYTSKETIRTYESECTKLEAFRPIVAFADIDYLFLTNYRNHMLTQLGNEPNTVWKSLKFINTMINKAIKMKGIITSSPFEEFDRGKYVQGQRDYLELSHCDHIEKLCLDEEQPVALRRVAIYFLLMAYSGMRFEDAMAFEPAQHVRDGRIVMTYQKFETDINNLIWDRLATVCDLVRRFPLKMSNQKFNQWLKVVGAMAKVPVPLTSHMGRHTMGGLLAEMEVPRESARIILGHRDIRSTDIYYHQKAKTIDRGMLALNGLNK